MIVLDMIQTPYPKPDWTVRRNITLPEDLHAEAKHLARRDGLQVYAVIAEALRLYQGVYPTQRQEVQP